MAEIAAAVDLTDPATRCRKDRSEMAHQMSPATRRSTSVWILVAAALTALPVPSIATADTQLARIRPIIDFQQISVEYCMDYLAKHGAYFGDPNNIAWHPNNIAWLCEINEGWQEVPPRAIQCFSAGIESGLNWSASIVACRKAAGELARAASGAGPDR